MKAPPLDDYDYMGIVSGSVTIPLDVHPLDDALGLFSKHLLHEPAVLGHRGGTTVILLFISFSGSPRPHRVVLGSVRWLL